MIRKIILLTGIVLFTLPVIIKAQCSGSWSSGSTLTYLCATGPFLQYDLGVSCPATPQTIFTFSTAVQSVKLIFSAFGSLSSPGNSRMTVFLNGSAVDLNNACKITLGCQSPTGTYSIAGGCLKDNSPGHDGGISGFIYISASAFSLSSITSIGVAVSEPGATGTVFQLDSCNISLPECLATGISEPASKTTVVYPNPFTDHLEIYSDGNEREEIILYDIASRIVMQQNFVKTVLLGTDKIGPGIYFYEIRNSNGMLDKGKIIRQ